MHRVTVNNKRGMSSRQHVGLECTGACISRFTHACLRLTLMWSEWSFS